MDKDRKRKAASVHQRLLNKARSTNRPFNELLQYYAMERFLFRMSQSEYVDTLVLKGALLLRVIGISEIRSTRDIDFLGVEDRGIEQMKSEKTRFMKGIDLSERQSWQCENPYTD